MQELRFGPRFVQDEGLNWIELSGIAIESRDRARECRLLELSTRCLSTSEVALRKHGMYNIYINR